MIKRCGWTVLCLTTRPIPARYGWTCQELPPTGIAQRVIGVHKLPYHDKITVHKEERNFHCPIRLTNVELRKCGSQNKASAGICLKRKSVFERASLYSTMQRIKSTLNFEERDNYHYPRQIREMPDRRTADPQSMDRILLRTVQPQHQRSPSSTKLSTDY